MGDALFDGAARLMDDVATAPRHHQAVQDAVLLLRHTGHADLAGLLATTWEALGVDGEPTVYTLPPEPPVGTTVVLLDERMRVVRLTRIARPSEYRWRDERWRGCRHGASCRQITFWRWDEVMRYGAREVEGVPDA